MRPTAEALVVERARTAEVVGRGGDVALNVDPIHGCVLTGWGVGPSILTIDGAATLEAAARGHGEVAAMRRWGPGPPGLRVRPDRYCGFGSDEPEERT